MRYCEEIETRFTVRHQACISLSSTIKGKVMLDLGCWIGWYEKFMVKRGCELIVGVDVDHKALRKAKESLRQDNADFICSSCVQMPFKPHSFDIVSLFDVMEHLPSGAEVRVLSEARELLRNRGTMLISTPNDNPIAKLLDPAYFLVGHRHYSLSKLKRIVEKAGFTIHEVKYGGGIIELVSMILLYIFKHIFNMEVPFKKVLEYLRTKEYMGEGFATIFINAWKT